MPVMSCKVDNTVLPFSVGVTRGRLKDLSTQGSGMLVVSVDILHPHQHGMPF